MSLPSALPSPANFIGVALVVNRVREGPRFVFHYPSRITPPLDHLRRGYGVDQSDDEDDLINSTASALTLGNPGDYMPNAAELARWNHDDHLATDDGTQVVPWEFVAGLPTKALGGILTPPRAFSKKRFQISLNSLCYVSYPIYVPSSGFWDRERRKHVGKHRLANPSADLSANPEELMHRNSTEWHEKEDKASSMTMFNLVFILNPERHEASELVDAVYAHIVQEVNNVYKYCQEREDFVWQECKRIIQLKEKACEDRTKMSVLWEEILATSSLATSMRDLYNAVCSNKVAVLDLKLGTGSVGHSMQIPMPFHVEDVQPQGATNAQSLILTTANSVPHYDMVGGLPAFDKCSTLLLADDDDKIIKDLQVRGGKAASAMIDLVKAAKPTLSFHQIVQLPDSVLTIEQVRAYAQHFIYWRRAMAIPPIHARDVYVLSPNCDLNNLARATASFAREFPFAPPFPDFVAGLSAAPRPYKSFCPSKSLRPAYLRILAWLIRGGWVCQLCTFAYVIVWPEIQYEVEYELESQDLAHIKQKQQKRGRNRGGQGRFTSAADNEQHPRHLSVTDTSGGTGGEETPISFGSSYTSPSPIHGQKRDTVDGDSRSRQSAAEHAAEWARRKRIAENAAHSLAERATAHARKPAPSHTEHPSVNTAPHLAGMLPHVILDAGKPTGRESLYLSAIERHIRARRLVPPPVSKKDEFVGSAKGSGPSRTHRGQVDEVTAWNERIAEMWPVFWKYFNGGTALERIALLEDLKRKDVWNVLSAMSEHLLCVRHW